MWFPRADAMKVLTAARQKVVLDSMVERMKVDIQNYEIAVSGLQQAMKAYATKDSLITASYEREISLYAEQRKVLDKALRKQVTKTRVAAIAGILFGVGALLLR